MTGKPFGTELVNDAEFEHLVTGLSRRPGMYVNSESDLFGAVCSFIQGYDLGRGGTPLLGFHQWLVVRRDGGNNVCWPGLNRWDLDLPKGSKSDEELIDTLGKVILEFIGYRRSKGLTSIFHDYSAWLLRQSWYEGPLRQ